MIKSVQRGTLNITVAGFAGKSGTINITAVDTSKAILIINCAATGTMPTANENRMPVITGQLNASSISYYVSGNSNTSGYTCRIDWQVVEYE